MAWKQTTPRKLKLWTPVSKDKGNWNNQDLNTYIEVKKKKKKTFPWKIVLKQTKISDFGFVFYKPKFLQKAHIAFWNEDKI